jgi:ribosomal protein L39E
MGLGAVIPVEPYWPTAPVTTPGDSDSRKLWQGLAACHQDSLVDLAVAIAGVADAAQAVCELQAIRLVDTVDASRVRLSAASRGAAAVDDWVRMQHARAVHAAIVRKDWRVVSDVLRAVDFALESDWMLAQDLGRRTASYLREQRRNAEAAELLHRVLSAATLRGDDSIRSECEWELSWLEDAPDAVRTPILPRGQLALF